jgi:hypothetical protein
MSHLTALQSVRISPQLDFRLSSFNLHQGPKQQNKTDFVACVGERNIPPLVCEDSANFC